MSILYKQRDCSHFFVAILKMRSFRFVLRTLKERFSKQIELLSRSFRITTKVLELLLSVHDFLDLELLLFSIKLMFVDKKWKIVWIYERPYSFGYGWLHIFYSLYFFMGVKATAAIFKVCLFLLFIERIWHLKHPWKIIIILRGPYIFYNKYRHGFAFWMPTWVLFLYILL